MLIKYEEELYIFLISRGLLNTNTHTHTHTHTHAHIYIYM